MLAEIVTRSSVLILFSMASDGEPLRWS